jgi:hypothetical protein
VSWLTVRGSPEQFLDKTSFLCGKQTFTGASLWYQQRTSALLCAHVLWFKLCVQDLLPVRQADLHRCGPVYNCSLVMSNVLLLGCVALLVEVEAG